MKKLVRIRKMVAGEDGTMNPVTKIEAFNSISEFNEFIQPGNPARKDVMEFYPLDEKEIEEYLQTLKAAVAAADLRKVEAKQILESSTAANNALFEVVGPGYMFQDADGTVYKTAVCEGKFVHFDPVEIKRTRRAGEAKGTLSRKEAEAAGFKLPEEKK